MSARFEPIRQRRAHEYVAEQILRHIALRLFQPGDSLPPERELAAVFGVGRPTIQQAIRILEASGLVNSRRGRHGGTFISQRPTTSIEVESLIGRVIRQRVDLEHVLVYRRLVEPLVARVAAERRKPSDLRRMKVALVGIANAISEPEYMKHDTDFHIAIARSTQNPYLVRAIEEIRLKLNDAITLLPESEEWHKRISDEHEALLAAVEGGDGEAAERIMDGHVEVSEQGLRAVLIAIRRQSTAK